MRTLCRNRNPHAEWLDSRGGPQVAAAVNIDGGYARGSLHTWPPTRHSAGGGKVLDSPWETQYHTMISAEYCVIVLVLSSLFVYIAFKFVEPTRSGL